MKLANDKHELFAQSMIKTGGSWKEVMKLCGYKESQPFFSQLKHSDKIQARIAELQRDAVNEKILSLTERLEMLSDIARDVNLPKGTRITALREIHAQSGDAVQRVEMNSTTENVIRYVDIKLPNKNAQEDETINEDALDGLDEFLRNAGSDISDMDPFE